MSNPHTWLPFALVTTLAVAIWVVAATQGHAWEMIWLPAVVAGAAWPSRHKKPSSDVSRGCAGNAPDDR